MPMYDRRCENGHDTIDCYEPMEYPEVVVCSECSAPTKRLLLSRSANVIQDSIEGGVWIRHGICNADGSPKKYYSRSEIAKATKEKGLVNLVEHVTAPESGSDRSKHTVRWI